MSRPTSLRGAWAKLAEAYGGVGKLAAALGVSKGTIWRWGTGGTIPSTSAMAITAVAEIKGVQSPVKATTKGRAR
jgi:hypothetical protein